MILGRLDIDLDRDLASSPTSFAATWKRSPLIVTKSLELILGMATRSPLISKGCPDFLSAVWSTISSDMERCGNTRETTNKVWNSKTK